MTELRPGDRAPDFEAPDAQGRTWSLRDLKGSKVILYFYPADDTPGCTKEACDFRDALPELDEAGYRVIGVSPQDASSHAAFAAKHGLTFPLLVDTDLRIARAYGVAGDFGEYKGIPLQIRRSTFVIDEDGVIKQALYGVDPRTHVAELRSKLG